MSSNVRPNGRPIPLRHISCFPLMLLLLSIASKMLSVHAVLTVTWLENGLRQCERLSLAQQNTRGIPVTNAEISRLIATEDATPAGLQRPQAKSALMCKKWCKQAQTM